ncbi:MAG: hypothetical protein ACFFBD_26375 [Candidatus Hodarchaeota archaeon]
MGYSHQRYFKVIKMLWIQNNIDIIDPESEEVLTTAKKKNI